MSRNPFVCFFSLSLVFSLAWIASVPASARAQAVPIAGLEVCPTSFLLGSSPTTGGPRFGASVGFTGSPQFTLFGFTKDGIFLQTSGGPMTSNRNRPVETLL